MTDTGKTITVHVSSKQSVTQYEPVEVGAAITWPMPDDATESDLAGQHTLLYEMLKAAVAEQVADMVATLHEARAVPAPAQPSKPALVSPPPADNELDAHFGPREEPPASSAPQNTEAGQGGSQELKYAPKASDRQPGQWWVVDVEQYSLSGKKLDLYRKDAKYPDATIYEGSPAWPTAWMEHMQTDGERHDLAKPVRVRQQVSEKQNSKGYFYVDVTDLTVLKEAA